MNERRKYLRSLANEPICAVFDSGAFGQLVDISKNGVSVELIGTTKLNQEIILDMFQLSGTKLISGLHCKIVRRIPLAVDSDKVDSKSKGSELICLSYLKDEPHMEHIIQKLQ